MMPDYPDREEAAFKKLNGRFKHYCHDWDYMAIDETCPEFEACTCFIPEALWGYKLNEH